MNLKLTALLLLLLAGRSVCAQTQVGGAGGGAQLNGTNNWTGPQSFLGDIPCFQGPNPYVDARCYGVRALSTGFTPAISGITSTTTAGLPTVTVSTSSCTSQTSNVCFVNGDGVAVANAGATIGLGAAPTPTVTPSNARMGTGTGDVVNAPAHATTYNYKILACDQAGGCTAVGTAGSTTTGNASLGAQNLAFTTATRSNDTITWNTASQADVGAGAVMHVNGCSIGDNALGFCGWFKISTVTATTVTAAVVSLDTRNGAVTASGGGGTLNWWNANHVTWTAVTGSPYFYVVQSDRQGGGFVNIGMSWPVNGTFTDGVLTFDDFGQTMMANNVNAIPWYVPTSGAATNDLWVTTILSGAGTTTLTMSGNAPNSNGGGQTIRFDNAPIISSMVTSLYSGGQGPAIYFAVDPNGKQYCTNSVLDLTSQSPTLLFPNGFNFKATVKISTGSQWFGSTYPPMKGNTPSFAPKSNPTISFGASPGMHMVNGSTGVFDGLTFNGVSGGVAIMQDGGGGNLGTSWDFVNFVGAGTSSDHMSMAFVCRGQNGQASCPAQMGTILVSAGAQSQESQNFTPGFYISDLGEFSINHLMGSSRSFIIKGDASAAVFRIGHTHWQGGTIPLISINDINGGVFAVLGDSGPITLDTMPQASVFYANLGHSSATWCGGGGCGLASSGFPTFTGNAFSSVIATGGPVSGHNKNTQSQLSGLAYDGTFIGVGAGSTQNYTQSLYNSALASGTGYPIFVQGATPATPTCSVSAGGTLPLATYTFKVAPIWQNGGEGVYSNASLPCTTTSGNQTITINWTVIPGNPKGVSLYQNGAASNTFGNPQSPTATSLVWSSHSFNSFSAGAGLAAAGGPTMLMPGTQGFSAAAEKYGAPPVDSAPAATLTGTGACLTGSLSAQTSGAMAGIVTCGGTTGASTLIIAPGGTAAAHGFACSADDETTANTLRQTAHSTTNCTISGTVNANDVLIFRVHYAF